MSNAYIQMFPKHEQRMLLSAFQVIHRLEAWEFLKTYSPPKNTGFMFDINPKIQEIISEIVEMDDSHSGRTIAYTMRVMETMAKSNEY